MSGLGVVKFWITPEGKAFFVEDTHIMAVLSDPQLFGYEGAEELWARFDANGEKRGSEGQTRAEILTELMARGFMRVRSDRNRGRFVINCVRTGGAEMGRARRFLKKLATGAHFSVCGKEAPENRASVGRFDPRSMVEFVDFTDGRVLLRSPMSWLLGDNRRTMRPVFRSGD